jgi:phage terminase large subunit-like protein
LNSGSDYTERAFIAGNQNRKNTTGLYEIVTHCTGNYPEWWKGKKFNRPVMCWLVGDRGDSIRDGMQRDLMGKSESGTGLIPKDLLISTSALQGTPNGFGTYVIKHKSGGNSTIIVKTYQAGKNAFESAKVDVIMLDEECPMDIYVECQIRTITTGGTVYNTFTPDSGLTETVIHLMEKAKPGEQPKFVTMVGWDDVPHLSEERKKQLLATIPPHMRDVKTKGVPYLGTGAIYPIPEDDITCAPFEIPYWWPKAYALDPSWGRTAAVWGAYDEQNDIWYIYSTYVRGQAEIPIHVDAIKSRGTWIEGVIDPYAVGGGRGKDGEAFLAAYAKHGLNLQVANNAREAGIQEVYGRLSTGRLKVFSTLNDFFYEYRMYRRDDKGNVVKKNDHLMDATRYLVRSGFSVMEPVPEDDEDDRNIPDVGRSSITGY